MYLNLPFLVFRENCRIRPPGQILAHLGDHATVWRAGRPRAEIDTVLPLEDAAKAHERGDTGRVSGKIALTVG